MPKCSMFPLAVVAAGEDEIRLLRTRLLTAVRRRVGAALITTGVLEKTPLLLVRTGMGRKAVEPAMRQVLERYRPGLCLHIGYGGAASPALRPGDLIIASSVVEARSGQRYEVAPELVRCAARIRREQGWPGQCGAVVTVEEAAHEPHVKAALGREHQALGIDMESAAVAAAVAAAGIPYLVVRAVLDPLDYHLPDPRGAPQEDRSAGRRRPNPLKLPPLKDFAEQARRALAAFVEAWVRNMVPPSSDL